MATIRLTTVVNAPVERAFDLWRSIDAHQISTKGTSEVAIAGKMSGLIGLDEEVTWRARHLGVTQTLSARISRFERPYYFQDVMVSGAFAWMTHDHYFKEHGERTVIEDVFEYEAPFGILGRFVEWLFLTSYMTRFLETRNRILKEIIEGDRWNLFLDSS
jgi:ligand-binding SRPBCC domain-containing protein